MKSFAPEVVTYTPPRVEVQTLHTEQGFAASVNLKANWFELNEVEW